MSNDEGIAIPSPWKAELGDADAVVAGVSPANMEKLQPARLPLQLHGGSRSLPLHLAVRRSQHDVPYHSLFTVTHGLGGGVGRPLGVG
jgi:hypothetical protein